MIRLLRYFIPFSILLFSFCSANAQMEPAKEIPPKYKNSIKVDAPIADVWEVISKPKRYAEWVYGVKSFECKGSKLGARVSLELTNGEKRKQEVSVIAPRNKIFAFLVKESTYMKGEWVYRFRLEDKGGKTKINYEVFFGSSSSEADKRILNKFRLEWKDISKGIESQF